MEEETKTEAAAEKEEGVVTPEDINNMSSEDFNKYMEELDSDITPSFEETPEENFEQTFEGEETTDTEPAEPEEQPVEQETEEKEQEPQPFRTFGTEEEYNNDVQRRINEAVENDRRTRDSDQTYRRLSDTARLYYRDAEDPMKAMADDMDRRAAEMEGLSPEEYSSRRNDVRDAQAYRDLMKQQNDRRQAQQQLVSRWNNEAQVVKTLYPDFDMRQALQNETFKRDLASGKSVAEAYKDMQEAAAPVQTARTPIPQNVQSKRSGTGEAAYNPAALPTADFMKYINKIRES